MFGYYVTEQYELIITNCTGEVAEVVAEVDVNIRRRSGKGKLRISCECGNVIDIDVISMFRDKNTSRTVNCECGNRYGVCNYCIHSTENPRISDNF